MVRSAGSLYGRKVRFRVQRIVTGDDFAAEGADTYKDLGRSFAAKLVPERAQTEFVSSDQMKHTNRFLIDVRRLKHMCWTSSDRLVRESTGEVYNIDDVSPLDERETWLRLTIVKTDQLCEC